MEFSPVASPSVPCHFELHHRSNHFELYHPPSHFDKLPPEIVKEILSFLPIVDFLLSKSVCKLWNKLTQDLSCYEKVCLNWWANLYSTKPKWKKIPLKKCIPTGCDWKWLMKCFLNKEELRFFEEADSIRFGEFKDIELSGKGAFIYSNDGYYVGEWRDGYRHGQGNYTWEENTTYSGEWKNGYRFGFGVCHWANGFSFSGNFQTGIPTDRSSCTHPQIQKCLDTKVCTATVTKDTKNYGQIIYECSCGKCFCLSCVDCHQTCHPSQLRETWVHCLDHCDCFHHPETCLHKGALKP